MEDAGRHLPIREFSKMLVIGGQAKDLHLLFIKNRYKVMKKIVTGIIVSRYLEKQNVS